MEPSVYIPAYLERLYAETHPDLTPAARDLLRERISQQPDAYATTDHARSLLAYAKAREELLRELNRLEDVPDEEFEQRSAKLFEAARVTMYRIAQADRLCIDAKLVDILLSTAPLDSRLNDLMRVEHEARAHLDGGVPGFDADAPRLWDEAFLAREGADAAALTRSEPEVVGWLHALEALSQECLATGRYKATASYARLVMRAAGYGERAVGTLLLALTRLEDEDAFFTAVRDAGEQTEDSPWFLLGRTLLLYKLGRRHPAKRALRDFANRCEGGAFFLLNPTYQTPYLPVRPDVRERWELTHQAVWEADGIIMDTPDFAAWAASIEGIEDLSEDFARRNGF